MLNLAGVGGFLLLWEAAGRWLGEGLLAPPSAVLPEFIALWRDAKVIAIVARSLGEMLSGYGLACLIGMPVGMAMGRMRVLALLVYPWLMLLIVTSVASLIPLFIILLGTGVAFRLTVVFASSVFYIALVTYDGARNLDRRLIDIGRSFGASALQQLRLIVLPALYPYVLTAARIGFAQSLRGMIVAEIFVIVGIGGLIHNAGQDISMARNLALLLLLMLIALSANEVMRRASHALAPWYQRSLKLE